MAKQTGQPDQSPRAGHHQKHPLKDLVKDIVFVLVSFFFLNSFVLASFEVPTGSMENEIMAGDFLFVNKFLYGGTTPRTIPFTNIRLPWFRVPAIRGVERGDVIVFEFPGQRDEVQSQEFMFYLKRAVALSGEVAAMLASERADDFLRVLYGDEPRAWRDGLHGFDRLRVIVNACTRMRFCTPDGRMEFREKRGREHAPQGFRPWFAHDHRRTAGETVVCGHWSTLELDLAPNVMMLDSGCLWGGTLTAVRLSDRRVYQVPSRRPVQPKPFG